MAITIRDLARMTNLNPSTVSRALRHDRRVKSATRERVLRLAEECKYSVNVSARNLAMGATGMIALLVPAHLLSVGLLSVAELTADLAAENYTLMVLPYAGSGESFDLLLEKLETGMCDGAFVVPVEFSAQNDARRNRIRQLAEKIPLIAFDQWIPGTRLPLVSTNPELALNALLGRMIAEQCDGAFVAFDVRNSVARIRKRLAEQLLRQRHIPFVSDIAELSRLIREKNLRRIAVFDDTPCRYWYLPEQTVRGGAEKVRYVGATFDHWEFKAPSCYDTIYLCIQDVHAAGRIAARRMLDLLQKKPISRTHWIPPIEIKKI